jgi:hypothetical protein
MYHHVHENQIEPWRVLDIVCLMVLVYSRIEVRGEKRIRIRERRRGEGVSLDEPHHEVLISTNKQAQQQQNSVPGPQLVILRALVAFIHLQI